MSTAGAVLDPLPCATYWCHAADELLYIGQAREPDLRIRQHRSRGVPWIDRVTRMDVLWFDTRVDALLMERKATRSDGPAYPSIVDGPRSRAGAVASLAADLRLFYGLDHVAARREAIRTLTASGYFDGASTPSRAGYTQAERDRLIFERMHEALLRVGDALIESAPTERRTA